METKISITRAIGLYYNATDLSAFADAIASETGGLDRNQYLAVLRDWKDQYSGKTQAIRKAKLDRKGEGNGWAQHKRQEYRADARALMGVRAGLKEIARRHHAARAQSVTA